MNIFFRELKCHVKSMLIWSATMVFLIAAGMMKYSAFEKTGEAINDMFASMPEGLLKIIGMTGDMDLTSVGVFYSIFFLYFLLLMSVHSAMLGATIISKEERDKTADFLVVKPLKRHQIVTPKVLAATVLVVLYNLVTFVFSALFVQLYNTTGESLTPAVFRLTTALLMIQLLFMGIGFLMGAVAKSAEKASSFMTAVILGTFVLKVIIDLKKDLDYLDFLTPFRYFDAGKVMFQSEIPFFYTLLSIAILLVTVAGTYYFFEKRDLHT